MAHRAEGINEDRLDQVYQKRDLKKYKAACCYVDILLAMRDILTTIEREDTEVEKRAHLGEVDPGFGLYGEIREWAIALLNSSIAPVAS